MASRPQPIPLHDHAIDNLRYIRATMEGAASFTAVPGLGGIWIGLSALFAAMLALSHPALFLPIWIAEAAVAFLLGGVCTVLKARAMEVSLRSAPARKFALAVAPPLLIGAVLTIAIAQANAFQLLPGVWMCLYGIAIIGGGAFSVRIVPVMGIAFLAAGIAALFTPTAWGNLWLAIAFGGFHVVFGALIARRHGG